MSCGSDVINCNNSSLLQLRYLVFIGGIISMLEREGGGCRVGGKGCLSITIQFEIDQYTNRITTEMGIGMSKWPMVDRSSAPQLSLQRFKPNCTKVDNLLNVSRLVRHSKYIQPSRGILCNAI